MSSKVLTHNQLVVLFNDTFLSTFNSCLKSGFDEPLYKPATTTEPAEICFRADYVSSALHEISHWCLAGENRRKLIDYGYWYEPDGRDAIQQKEFEKVEVKPQALEWIFSISAGVKFNISADNLDVDSSFGSSDSFLNAVIQQAQLFSIQGLPKRAEMFYQVLCKNSQFGSNVSEADLCIDYFGS